MNTTKYLFEALRAIVWYLRWPLAVLGFSIGFFVAGGLIALSEEQILIGLGMLAVAAFVLPTVFAIVWMRESKRKDGKK